MLTALADAHVIVCVVSLYWVGQALTMMSLRMRVAIAMKLRTTTTTTTTTTTPTTTPTATIATVMMCIFTCISYPQKRSRALTSLLLPHSVTI